MFRLIPTFGIFVWFIRFACKSLYQSFSATDKKKCYFDVKAPLATPQYRGKPCCSAPSLLYIVDITFTSTHMCGSDRVCVRV